MTEADARHWSAYWASGFLTSLPDDFKANYDREIASFWSRQLEQVPASGHVLDVCTGNGAVALLAAGFSFSGGHGFDITAADAAHIDHHALLARYPQQQRWLGDIRFLGASPLETLDLPAASFDLITSQYGIEYTRLPEAAARVEQLLKPGGRLAMICHASNSEMLTTMQRERAEYAWLEANGLFDMLVVDSDRDALALASKAGLLVARLRRQPGAAQSALYGSIMRLLEDLQSHGPDAVWAREAGLRQYAQALRMALLRLEDMLRVNQLASDQPDWYRVFEHAGLQLEGEGEVRYLGRHHAGNWYVFTKPQAGAEQEKHG